MGFPKILNYPLRLTLLWWESLNSRDSYVKAFFCVFNATLLLIKVQISLVNSFTWIYRLLSTYSTSFGEFLNILDLWLKLTFHWVKCKKGRAMPPKLHLFVKQRKPYTVLISIYLRKRILSSARIISKNFKLLLKEFLKKLYFRCKFVCRNSLTSVNCSYKCNGPLQDIWISIKIRSTVLWWILPS